MAGVLVKVPDLLRAWPWQRHLGEHYDEVKAQSVEWFVGFGAFDAKSQDAFDRCEFDTPLAKLAMLSYRFGDLARCRTGADLIMLFYAFDEYTNVADEVVTRELADMVMDGLRNPDKPRPADECLLGEMARQFWSTGREYSSAMAERHLLETMQLYVDAVVQQSADWATDRLRTIDDYLAVRRHTSGCLPSFALAEMELDVPEDVYRHPLLERMRDCGAYLIIASNDLYSYPVERARGHALHNLVTTVMYQLDLAPQAAVDWIGNWSDGIAAEFLECRANLPSWGPEIDEQIHRYVDGIASWVRGADDWSFESQRYFGVAGEEVRRTREIYMLPRVERDGAGSAALREGVVDAERLAVAAMQIRRDLALGTSPE
ncbi:terpenoid synthase [Echria macrotheca]|uniref:Terpene synthase n=1 Tax=Echria macrotheca TaxID=438768 RepID=A0AAJ0FCZ3_9PEZI|nr:terpenoid synthase [Echria macrotheca]